MDTDNIWIRIDRATPLFDLAREFLFCFVSGSDLFYVGFSLLTVFVRFKGILVIIHSFLLY